jgi:hypothetical protein
VLADATPDPILKLRRQRGTVPEPHEEHDPLAAVPLLPDGQAFDNVLDLLDLAIDLRRADAYAAGIEYGV